MGEVLTEGRWLFLKSMLVTTATILGIGILALPVRVGAGGMLPFAATFTVALACQVGIICFVTELLQRTEVEIEVKACEDRGEMERLETCLSNESASVQRRQRSLTLDEDSPNPVSSVSTSDEAATRANLHNMAEFFIPSPVARFIFDACVYLHFIIVMIAYAISASNAFGSLFSVTRGHIIVAFAVTLAMLIIVCDKALTSAVAAFTFFKAGLLVLMIIIVMYVASHVHRPYQNHWPLIGEAFLIGTVSLGGSTNVLPVLYSSFVPTAANVASFRNGCVTGTILCWVLNLTWTYCILIIVPQHSDAGPSLAEAARKHDISTIPLLQFLAAEYPRYEFIGVLVNVFIIISVTVSFIALGLGMKNYVDGAVASVFEDERTWQRHRYVAYGVSFGSILVVALFFSHSLYVLLDVFNSALLNVETGIFMAYMTYATRLKPTSDEVVNVSVQLPRPAVVALVGITSMYFGGAVLYDIMHTVYRLSVYGTLH